jgi:preprotein translocase subunit SecF
MPALGPTKARANAMFPVPNFKGFDFFPHGTHLDFMRLRDVCFIASLLFMLLSLGLFFVQGLNYGVDFKGGMLVEVQTKGGPADITAMRQKLSGIGLGEVQIQSFGTPNDVLIRVEAQPGGEQAQQDALKKVIATLGPTFESRRTEVVGPAVSAELRQTCTIAVLAAILAIIAYVWFRFEWQFALGTVVALAHDVLLTVGLFSAFNLEFDLTIVAALLTILGYSVNDTVVVSDRIRENLRKFKKMPLNDLLNLSINETLSRTILTGVTTLVVLMILWVFGGEVIRNFSFAMLCGVLVGTYSSIFIASPILGYLGVPRDLGEAAKAKDEKTKISG